MSYALGGESNHYQPSEPVLCDWCDGCGAVSVASIHDAGGKVQMIADPTGHYIYNVEVPCPRCCGTGEEPKPERR